VPTQSNWFVRDNFHTSALRKLSEVAKCVKTTHSQQSLPRTFRCWMHVVCFAHSCVPWFESESSQLLRVASSSRVKSLFQGCRESWLLSLVKELVKSICPLRELIAVWIRLGVNFSIFHFPLVLWREMFSYQGAVITIFSTNVLEV